MLFRVTCQAPGTSSSSGRRRHCPSAAGPGVAGARSMVQLQHERDRDDDESAAPNAALTEAPNPPVTLPIFNNEIWEYPPSEWSAAR